MTLNLPICVSRSLTVNCLPLTLTLGKFMSSGAEGVCLVFLGIGLVLFNLISSSRVVLKASITFFGGSGRAMWVRRMNVVFASLMMWSGTRRPVK